MTGSTRAPWTTDGRGRRALRALAALLVTASAARAGDAEPAPAATVEGLLQRRCAIPACHSGGSPQQGMSLEAGRIIRDTVNVPARSDRKLLRVDPGNPEGSLLYRKLLSPAEGGYRGEQMPRMFIPLDEDERELVRRWIAALGEPPGGAAAAAIPARTWLFHDAFLINLPTAERMGRRELRFRVAHRFQPSAPEAGAQDLLGIDGGAWVSLELAYGFSRRWEVGLRHSTLGQEEEGSFKVGLADQVAGAPLSLSIVGSLANQREGGVANETSAGLQVVLARGFGEHISLMAVPMYVTRTNTLNEEDESGTLALGLGGQWNLSRRFAITGEWIGQLAGVEAPYQSGSLGFSIRTARHAFHLVGTNTRGVHVDLYAPGGDLDIDQEDFRLGFNITRWFGGG